MKVFHSPPKPKADVCVPAPPKKSLAVFKSFNSVQEVPFQDSVILLLLHLLLQNAKAEALLTPAPPLPYLPVF
jgi:hypothetical protein